MGESKISDQPLQDRLFLLDVSRSMGWHIRGGREIKIDLMKDGLMAFCSKLWPLSYFDRPIRLGIVAFRLIGIPGDSKFDVIVPLYPSPMSLELYRLQVKEAKGGCYISDGLKYGSILLRESDRPVRRLDIITDEDIQGPDPIPYAKIYKDSGIFLNLIELSENPTPSMQEVASQSAGKYWLVRNAYDLAQALE